MIYPATLITVFLILISGVSGSSAGVFLVLAYLPLSLWMTKTRDIPEKKRLTRWLIYALPPLLIAGFIWSIDIFVQQQILSISQVVRFHPLSLAITALVILSAFGLQLLLYELIKKAKADKSQLWRLLYYGIVIIISALALFHEFKIFTLALLCGCIYFLLLDLFTDQSRASIVWAMVWMIIIGSFITLTVFYFESNYRTSTDGAIPILNAFSFFSLTFILSAIILVAIAFVNGKTHFLPAEWDFNLSHRRQLRNRIQLAILLTLLFSFVAIGFVSVYHLRLSGNLNSSFIQALLNTYVFLFLIGFAISMSLAEYIRNPLIELGRTLKNVKLHKENAKIDWEGNDEIGNLIKEYNHMIDKLQENALLLARTERDSAWREMAKQVAHEIKNPLTPMKLSLQHLEKTISAGRSDAEAVTLRMCNTLMNQVENLRQIADEFSNFGSLPKANNERILLNEVVEKIHDLFRKREDMDINLIEPIDDIGVYADRNHLVRVLNNLVKNSIQSIPEDRKGNIELKLYREESKAIIRVRDNGVGIPEVMRDEIFKPRFTTKSSGSGLGLAISANMVDAIGGRIYFESVENQGTDFFVELPLIRSKFSENSTRVSLDEL